MDKLWYYTQGAEQEKNGPVPEDQIRLLIASGQIQSSDLLWSEGMADWLPLSALPQLKSPSSQLASAFTAPAASGAAGIPEGLTGWMTFVAVMTIITGAVYCLSCVWIIIGIPTLIAGTALLGAKNAIVNMGSVDASLSVFFAKLKSFFKITGIVYIIGFIIGIVIFILYFGVIAAAIAGKSGMHP